jgi:hypothetical protein
MGGGSLPPPLTHARTDPKLRGDHTLMGPRIDPAEHMRCSIKIGCRRLKKKKKVVFLVEDHRIGGPLPSTLPTYGIHTWARGVLYPLIRRIGGKINEPIRIWEAAQTEFVVKIRI